MNKKIELTVLFSSALLYIYIMFISGMDAGTGKKELENII
jgi:hypothetical protein